MKTMNERTRFLIGASLIMTAIFWYVIGVILLPETIGLKANFGGGMKAYVSKYIGLLIPQLMTLIGAWVWMKSGKQKGLVMAGFGTLMSAMLIYMN